MKPERIYHTWDKWECYPAGFYESGRGGIDTDTAKKMYRDFLLDDDRFRVALIEVLALWKNSCEHYLTNENMNRIAWLGQAAACISLGLPSCYRSGYFLLTKARRDRANATALEFLNKWMMERGYDALSLNEAGVAAKANIY